MFLPAALALLAIAQPAEKPKPFEFKDGDRIVWIGNTLVEREQRYGYWETALLAANADKKITVRNLGWSGDTVFGDARGRFDFDNAAKCFKQLVEPHARTEADRDLHQLRHERIVRGEGRTAEVREGAGEAAGCA